MLTPRIPYKIKQVVLHCVKVILCFRLLGPKRAMYEGWSGLHWTLCGISVPEYRRNGWIQTRPDRLGNVLGRENKTKLFSFAISPSIKGIVTLKVFLRRNLFNVCLCFVGCSYKGTCYDLGARVMEDCNTLVCSYDDVSLGYDLILQQQGMLGRSRTL